MESKKKRGLSTSLDKNYLETIKAMRKLGMEDRQTIAIPNLKNNEVNKEYQADLQQCKFTNLKDLEDSNYLRLKSTPPPLFFCFSNPAFT